ncbi:VOC family protein [Aerococcaceae bacterium WGS1372]
MFIKHIALWVEDLEGMKTFYETYFNAQANELYYNPKTKFSSYFLTFESGSRLELTTKKFLSQRASDSLGYTHLAMAVGTKEDVNHLTQRLVEDGYPLLNGPRTTGDGYYEAVIQDPEGNLIELTTTE